MEETIAISDVGTMLYVLSGSVYEELVGIRSVPASGSAGGSIDVTELKSAVKQNIPDRPESPDQDFEYNYTDAKYTKVKTVCDGDAHTFLVKYQDGSGHTITGIAQTWKLEVSGGSEVKGMLHIVPTNIADKTTAEVTTLLVGTSL
jgi:hypothetical protein